MMPFYSYIQTKIKKNRWIPHFNLEIYLQFSNYLRCFYLQLRDTADFKWTPELQQKFDRVQKELTDRTLRLAIPNSYKSLYILCDASNYGIGDALFRKTNWENRLSFRKFSLIFHNSTQTLNYSL